MLRLRCITLALALLTIVSHAGADPLSAGFREPPQSARPLVFWQWMNGCVTKEGITSDLESYRRVGLGGVQNFLVGGSEAIVTDPTVQILNPKWRELMRFALDECARLGLSFGTHNCPGWSASGSPGVRPEDAMKKLVWSTTDVEPGRVVVLGELPRPEADARYYREVLNLAVPNDGRVEPQQVQIISTARWTAPAGQWRIYRFGETLTGSVNGTAPLSGQGLEVDKLDRAALDRFWQTYPAELIALAGEHAGRTFTRLELDSYEAGPQEWTTDALAQFEALCGYDARPWLPVFAGATVGDEERTRRFREDWRMLVAHLFTRNYFGRLGERVRETPGMEFLLEPYATGHGEFFSTAEISAAGDQLMAEFWWGPTTWGWDSIKPVASAAHTLGRRVVLAEAFTGQPQYAWRVAPFDLKPTGDRAFAMGVNRVILHAAAHQPWPALKPGMTMGWWGTQFGPGQTWWEHGGPEWLAYLSRCQFLLQQGRFVGDLAYFTEKRKTPALPAGYDADTMGESAVIERLSVREGRLVLPEGMEYRVLVLPEAGAMRIEVLEALHRLVDAGAVIVGPRPTRSSGLRGGAEAQQRFQTLADVLWGPLDAGVNVDRAVGRGRVFAGRAPEMVLRELGLEPDVEISPHLERIRWTHRRTDTEDIYFVSNQGEAAEVEVTFRAKASEVELWHADTGEVEVCQDVRVKAERTQVRLSLEQAGSRFVVFRSVPTPGRSGGSAARTNMIERHDVSGPWTLSFPPGLGAPAAVELDTLLSWPSHGDDGVKHFSGTATYSRKLMVSSSALSEGRRVLLNLGDVRHIAEVRLNGKAFPALWKPPYRLDVTSAVCAGENALEIDVTNLWPNRLIRDSHEPEDVEWGELRTFGYVPSKPPIGRPLLRIPLWVVENSPRPSSRRMTFTTFDFFTKDTPLLESGLLGAVALEITEATRDSAPSGPGG